MRWEGPFRSIVDALFGRRTAHYLQQEVDAFAQLAEQAPPAP